MYPSIGIIRITCLILLATSLIGCRDNGVVRPDTPPAEQFEWDRQRVDQAYERGEWGSAEAGYAGLIQRMPEDAELWFRLATIYGNTGRPERAVQFYRKALDLDPDHSKAWHNLGITHLWQAHKTFVIMQQYVRPDDPFYEQIERLLECMDAFIQAPQSAAGAGSVEAPQSP